MSIDNTEEESFTYSENIQNQVENERRVSKNKPVPLLDEITLGPIEKYTKFNIFPWGLLFHIFFLAVTSAQIFLVVNNVGIYARSQQKVWRNLFGEEVIKTNEIGFTGIRNMFTISSLSEHIQN